MKVKRSRTTLSGLFIALTVCCAAAASWSSYRTIDDNLILTVLVTAFVVALVSSHPWLGGAVAGMLAIAIVSYFDTMLVGNLKLAAMRGSIARLPTAWGVLLVPIAIAAWAGGLIRRWLSPGGAT